MKVLYFIDSFIDRLFVVLGALAGSQISPFIQQYTQRLAGHVEALEQLMRQLKAMAQISHQNLSDYIQKFAQNQDPDFRAQAEFMQGIVSQWQNLQQALLDLTHHSQWLRPYYFFKSLQPEIIKATLQSFEMSFSLTIEGTLFTLIGAGIGWGLYRSFRSLLSSLFLKQS